MVTTKPRPFHIFKNTLSNVFCLQALLLRQHCVSQLLIRAPVEALRTVSRQGRQEKARGVVAPIMLPLRTAGPATSDVSSDWVSE